MVKKNIGSCRYIVSIALPALTSLNCTSLFFSPGMTPLHCAAISHSVTMKALFSNGSTDVDLQSKAAEKLSCVQMLLNAGASLLSQVQ